MADIDVVNVKQIIDKIEKINDVITKLSEGIELRFSQLESRLEAQERKFPLLLCPRPHVHPRTRCSCSGKAQDSNDDEDGSQISEADSGLDGSQSGTGEELCCCYEAHDYAFPCTLAPLYLFLRSPSLRRRNRQNSDTAISQNRKQELHVRTQRSLKEKSQSLPASQFETIPEEEDSSQVFLSSLGSREEQERELHYKRRVETHLKYFIQYSNWECLAPCLMTKKLLNMDEYQRLRNKDTDSDKGMYFYKQILPSKGHDAHLRLYKCIHEKSDEHIGHASLLRILAMDD